MVAFKESEPGTVEAAPAPNQQPDTEVDVAPSKRTTAPAFQFYAAEFLAGDKVTRMSYTELGIFIALLCHAWTGNGLPLSVTEIAKKLKIAPPRFATMWRGVLSECWTERSGRLINPRQEIERKKQRDYRDKQRNAAASRWDKPKDAAAVPVHGSGNSQSDALQSSSLSSSSSSEERTHRQGGGPIHQSHRNHAACCRVCVPGDLHSHFVRSRNTPNADQELRDWYAAVDNEWSVGAKKDANTGGNDYKFWRARFDETWPDESAAAPRSRPDSRLPAWAQKAKAQP